MNSEMRKRGMGKLGRLAAGAALLAVVGIGTGCQMNRVTTTDKTAIEQGLMSQATERATAKMDLAALKGKTVFLDVSNAKASNLEYIVDSLKNQLATMDIKTTDSLKTSDAVLIPVIANSAIDDNDFLIGIPSIPIPVPGAGTFSTPELALYKQKKQKGRNRMAIRAENPTDRKVVAMVPYTYGEATFDRYTLLIFIQFRHTDMEDPF